MVCFVSNSKVRGQEVNPFAQQTWLSVKVHLGWIENLVSDFKGTAGEVRFANETLSIDIDGDQSADFAVALPGVTKLKGSNLIL